MGVCGEVIYPLSDLNEILHQSSSLKPSNDRGKFEHDQARSKNNIAENSFTLGHETHNRHID